MFNFIVKRQPSVNLLYGKRPLQRIEIGHKRHHVEIPLSVIDQLYQHVNTKKEYHNMDYNPLHWNAFFNLKLKAFYLYDASKSGQTTKTALTGLDFYPKLTALYEGHLAKTKTKVLKKTNVPHGIQFRFPIKGKNI